MDRQIPITREGLQRLEDELRELKTTKRQEVAQRLAEERDVAAFEDSAASNVARDQQAFVEGRIREIERILENATIIDEEHARASSRVEIGSSVRLRQNGRESSVTIVGTTEADPARGRISNESPVGRALLGKKPGDSVQVPVPSGVVDLEILAIE